MPGFGKLGARGGFGSMGVLGRASGYTLPTPILLDDFRSLTGLGSVTNGTVALGPESGTLLSNNGKAGTAFVSKTDAKIMDPATFATVVVEVIAKSPYWRNIAPGLALGRGGNYDQLLTGQQIITMPDGYGRWFYARHISEYPTTPVNLLTVGSGQVDRQLVAGTSNPFDSGVEFQSAYVNAAGRPTVVLTFDDGYAGQRDILLPLLNARNLKGTFFPAYANMGGSNPSLADWQTAYAAGHDIGFDGSSTDASLVDGVTWATASAALTQMKACRQYLIDNGMPRAADHGCWPFGLFENSTRATRVVTTTASSAVVALTSGNTTGLTAGMAFISKAFAAGTTILSVDTSTQLTLSSNTLTAGTGWGAQIVDTSQAFYNTKLLDAVVADGSIKTMRALGSGDYHAYTRWGLGDRKLFYPSYAWAHAATAADVLAQVDLAILRGTTLVILAHNFVDDSYPTPGTNDIFTSVATTVLDGLVSRVAARTLDLKTVTQWYARDLANPRAVGT